MTFQAIGPHPLTVRYQFMLLGACEQLAIVLTVYVYQVVGYYVTGESAICGIL